MQGTIFTSERTKCFICKHETGSNIFEEVGSMRIVIAICYGCINKVNLIKLSKKFKRNIRGIRDDLNECIN